MQSIIGPDNRETFVLTMPAYRTHMRQTRQDVVMHDAIVACDPHVLRWDLAGRDYDLDESGNLAAEYHVPLCNVLSLL